LPAFTAPRAPLLRRVFADPGWTATALPLATAALCLALSTVSVLLAVTVAPEEPPVVPDEPRSPLVLSTNLVMVTAEAETNLVIITSGAKDELYCESGKGFVTVTPSFNREQDGMFIWYVQIATTANDTPEERDCYVTIYDGGKPAKLLVVQSAGTPAPPPQGGTKDKEETTTSSNILEPKEVRPLPLSPQPPFAPLLDFTPNTTNVTFNVLGGETNVILTITQDGKKAETPTWESSNPSIFTANISSPSECLVTIRAPRNEALTNLESVVTITLGNKTNELHVIQAPRLPLALDLEEMTFEWDGGTQTNVAMSTENGSLKPTPIPVALQRNTIVNVKAEGQTTTLKDGINFWEIPISVSTNTTMRTLTNLVTFTLIPTRINQTNETVTLPVTQKGVPFTLISDSLTFEARGKRPQTVTVSTDDLDAKANNDFIEVERNTKKKENESEWKVTVEDNPTQKERRGTVTFTAKDGTGTRTLTVTQKEPSKR